MKAALLLILPSLFLVSCSTMKYKASVSPDGVKNEEFAYNTFGGSSAIDTAGGTRVAQNHNKTGGQFFQTVATGLAAWGRAAVVSSDNALAKSQGQQATAQQANARTPTIVQPQFGPHGQAFFPKVIPPPKPVVP
jgi:hypothetical protein